MSTGAISNISLLRFLVTFRGRFTLGFVLPCYTGVWLSKMLTVFQVLSFKMSAGVAVCCSAQGGMTAHPAWFSFASAGEIFAATVTLECKERMFKVSLVRLMRTGMTCPLQDALCAGLRQRWLEALLPNHLRDGKSIELVLGPAQGSESVTWDRQSWLPCRIWQSLALGGLSCHRCLLGTHHHEASNIWQRGHKSWGSLSYMCCRFQHGCKGWGRC